MSLCCGKQLDCGTSDFLFSFLFICHFCCCNCCYAFSGEWGMFQGQTRHKSRARKKTKYIHKNERGSSTRVSLKREQKNLNSVSERAFLRPKIISRLLERVAGVRSASGRTLIIISSRPLANHSLTLFSQNRKLTRRRRNARPAALVMRSCSQAQLKSSNDPLLLKRKLKDLSLFIAEGKGRGKGKWLFWGESNGF